MKIALNIDTKQLARMAKERRLFADSDSCIREGFGYHCDDLQDLGGLVLDEFERSEKRRTA
jgi:hypothetical protein